MPGGITGVAEQMFDAVAPEMHGFNRVALSNLWLTGPLVERMLSSGPSTNALMRTTTALTIVSGGNKENVIPGRADAIVNFRLLPGDTPDTVMAHLKQVIGDDRVQMAVSGEPSLPSKVSSILSYWAWTALASGWSYTECSRALTAPQLLLGHTDMRLAA